MLDFIQSLQGKDLAHLKIIAGLWGIEFEAPDARSGLRFLAETLLDRRLVEETAADLPSEARLALDDLLRNGGALSWPTFARRYGTVREMGPARRDRELPYQNPTSPAEILWYRGLVARAFQDTPKGPEEFAFIPTDLMNLLPAPGVANPTPLGRSAMRSECAYQMHANDRILDHTCTLLAALRSNIELKEVTLQGDLSYPYPLSPFPLKCLLSTAGLLDEYGLPLPEPTRLFLEAPRSQALEGLVRAWLHSADFNELRLLPGLRHEGEWRNDPIHARQAVLGFLGMVPGRDSPADAPFWSLAAFVDAVKQEHADFQRPAGDYDSWYLRDETSGTFLRGFEHWDQVDGALVRFLVCGPLHWLGILDLASPEEGLPPDAFRYSAWAADLLSGKAPAGLESEQAAPVARSDALLSVPRLAPRALRYQIARFCAWEGEKDDHYRYRLTAGSLERARQAGLRPSHLLALLRRHAPSVPPSLARAIERWEERGTEARLEQVTVLRLRSPDLLASLRNSRAARFLGEPLGPAAVIVKAGAREKVLAVLAELGYLGEIDEKGR